MIIKFFIVFLLAIISITTLQVQAKDKASQDYKNFLKDMLAKIESKSVEKSQPDMEFNQQESQYIREYRDIRKILIKEGK